MLADKRLVQPFGKLRKAGNGGIHGAAQHLARETRRQRIDRLHHGQVIRLANLDHVVRVNHGGAAVEPVDLAAHHHVLIDGERLFQPVPFHMKEGQRQFAGTILKEDR